MNETERTEAREAVARKRIDRLASYAHRHGLPIAIEPCSCADGKAEHIVILIPWTHASGAEGYERETCHNLGEVRRALGY
jgi:hypothetical protein